MTNKEPDRNRMCAKIAEDFQSFAKFRTLSFAIAEARFLASLLPETEADFDEINSLIKSFTAPGEA